MKIRERESERGPPTGNPLMFVEAMGRRKKKLYGRKERYGDGACTVEGEHVQHMRGRDGACGQIM